MAWVFVIIVCSVLIYFWAKLMYKIFGGIIYAMFHHQNNDMSYLRRRKRRFRIRKYNPDDYWNDIGNGAGVNYVQMPDGSVRID